MAHTDWLGASHHDPSSSLSLTPAQLSVSLPAPPMVRRLSVMLRSAAQEPVHGPIGRTSAPVLPKKPGDSRGLQSESQVISGPRRMIHLPVTLDAAILAVIINSRWDYEGCQGCHSQTRPSLSIMVRASCTCVLHVSCRSRCCTAHAFRWWSKWSSTPGVRTSLPRGLVSD